MPDKGGKQTPRSSTQNCSRSTTVVTGQSVEPTDMIVAIPILNIFLRAFDVELFFRPGIGTCYRTTMTALRSNTRPGGRLLRHIGVASGGRRFRERPGDPN